MKGNAWSYAVIIFNDCVINMNNVVALEYNSEFKKLVVHYPGEVGGTRYGVSKSAVWISCTKEEYKQLLETLRGGK